MRKRYIQVDDELLAEFASDLSVHLGSNVLEAIGHTNLLISWALNRCPKDRPPSASAVHTEPLVEKLIARACQYGGDPKAFIDAYCCVRPAMLERPAAGGVRFKGLRRYDVLWKKNYPEAAKAWKAAHPEWQLRAEPEDEDEPPGDRSETGRFPNGNRGESDPLDPDLDPDRDVDVQTETRERKPPPPRQPPKLVVVGKRRSVKPEELAPAARARWLRIQATRATKMHHGHPLLPETHAPSGFEAWSDQLDAQGVVDVQWVHAHALYLRDADFADRLWPTGVFITEGVFRQRLPPPPSSAGGAA